MSKPSKDTSQKLIAKNPIAFTHYFVEEKVEAGVALLGTEVKSLRSQSPNIKESYVEFRRSSGSTLEAWLCHAHIAPYSHGGIWNHEPLRARKLLLNRREIERMSSAVQKDGMTVIPVCLYFKKGIAKVELGIAKGKKLHDKREDSKRKSANREMDRARRRDRD